MIKMKSERNDAVSRFVICLLIGFLGSTDPVPVNAAEPLPSPLPQAVSNNAVAALRRDDVHYILSFMGLGAAKTHLDISREAWLWRSDTREWQAFPPVPVNEGRLASVAVGLADRIWLFGGYTVAADGSEVSTPEVFRIDPVARTYQRRADMPLPVDDTVALPYTGRYIYLVSGWHDSGNAAEVQLYDTHQDQWQMATPFPGVPVFGHAGGMVDGEMIIAGGVGLLGETDGKREFGTIDQAWKGVVDPEDPARIEWQKLPVTAGTNRYRMAASGSAAHRQVFFAGGTDRPYNYSGIGYDGQSATPTGAVFAWDLDNRQWLQCENLQRSATMDHRGLLHLDDGTFITLGGMDSQQQVSGAVVPFTVRHPDLTCGAPKATH